MPKTAKATTATAVAVTKTNNWPSKLIWAKLLLGQRAGREQWSALKPSYNNNASRESRRAKQTKLAKGKTDINSN